MPQCALDYTPTRAQQKNETAELHHQQQQQQNAQTEPTDRQTVTVCDNFCGHGLVLIGRTTRTARRECRRHTHAPPPHVHSHSSATLPRFARSAFTCDAQQRSLEDNRSGDSNSSSSSCCCRKATNNTHSAPPDFVCIAAKRGVYTHSRRECARRQIDCISGPLQGRGSGGMINDPHHANRASTR